MENSRAATWCIEGSTIYVFLQVLKTITNESQLKGF